MIGAWIGYSLLVATLMGAAAAAIEPAVRLARLPSRLVWLLAMGTTLVLVAIAPVRRNETPVPTAVTLSESGPAAAPGGGLADPLPEDRRWASSVFPELFNRLLSVVPTPRPGVSRTLGVTWLVATLAIVGLVVHTNRRYRDSLRRWPLGWIDGTPVRLTDDTGPAVLGFVRPEIAIPRWLLESPAEVQRMVLVHEREHVRSGDQILLGLGGSMVIVLPWLLPLWWMLRRLRLAIEVDCDARVLQRGVPLREYGSALIEAAARSPRLVLGPSLLTGPRTSLERRLQSMNRRPTGRRIARAAPLLPVGFAAVLVACATELPTSAEIEAMDLLALETSLQGLVAFHSDSVRYYLDGVEIAKEEAQAIPAESIASISVHRDGELRRASEVRMTSRGAADSSPNDGDHLIADRVEFRGTGDPGSIALVAPDADTTADVRYQVRVGPFVAGRADTGASGPDSPEPGPGGPVVRGAGEPLFVIDGIVAEAADFNRLEPTRIESISILKDASAAVYGFRAANGVVLVTTKRTPTVEPVARPRSSAPQEETDVTVSAEAASASGVGQRLDSLRAAAAVPAESAEGTFEQAGARPTGYTSEPGAVRQVRGTMINPNGEAVEVTAIGYGQPIRTPSPASADPPAQ